MKNIECAQIFISCGQKTDQEKKIAKEIEIKLINLGFKTFLACEEHTLAGLKDNILKNLESSEYYLFIDFHRERLGTSNEFRGSLYTNQELALAAFLDKEVIAFQCEYVIPLDGMLSSLHLNPIKFKESDIEQLPKLIETEVKNKAWGNTWKNKLSVSVNPDPINAPKIDGSVGNHFHLKVENLHKDKPALNCTAYILSIINKTNGKDLTSEKVEIKWAGSIIPNIVIMPQSYRLLDAFYILNNEPEITRFMSYSDSPYFLPPLTGIADYEITYLVMSENFPSVRISTRVNIKGSFNTVSFKEIVPPPK